MKFVSIIGARPDFVQVGVLSKKLRQFHDEVMVHTGQHYDLGMSEVFFSELQLPEPEINLGIGSKDATSQTGEMIVAIGRLLRETQPDAVIVRGDTNGTIAGSVAAKQELFPLVHIEAGCRSYDRTMPEEINRVASDHLSDVLMTTDEQIARNLAKEGITENVFVTGDVMYDTYLEAVRRLGSAPRPRSIPDETYVLLTIHRSENVDDRERLAPILAGFRGSPVPVIFPVHPRTRKRIAEFALEIPKEVTAIEPLTYFEMVLAERSARTIFTDSGGVQREAYYGKVPCVTLRDNTEWTNTVDAGWNRLVGSDTSRIQHFLSEPPIGPPLYPPLFGDGNATQHIIDILQGRAFASIAAKAREVRAARGRLRAPA